MPQKIVHDFIRFESPILRRNFFPWLWKAFLRFSGTQKRSLFVPIFGLVPQGGVVLLLEPTPEIPPELYTKKRWALSVGRSVERWSTKNQKRLAGDFFFAGCCFSGAGFRVLKSRWSYSQSPKLVQFDTFNKAVWDLFQWKAMPGVYLGNGVHFVWCHTLCLPPQPRSVMMQNTGSFQRGCVCPVKRDAPLTRVAHYFLWMVWSTGNPLNQTPANQNNW